MPINYRWIFQEEYQRNFELVGIHEPNAGLIQQFKERYKLDDALFFSDPDNMLDELQPDGALAFGPISEHLNVVRACAPRRIHVMVEILFSAIESAKSGKRIYLKEKNSIYE